VGGSGVGGYDVVGLGSTIGLGGERHSPHQQPYFSSTLGISAGLIVIHRHDANLFRLAHLVDHVGPGTRMGRSSENTSFYDIG
jgi:hypothetical protein